MKLTEIIRGLSNHIRFQNIPGNITIGKHRIWPKLTPKYKRYLMRRIDNEINNMKLISRPILTQEESKLVSETMRQEFKEKEELERLERIRANKNKMQDRLMSEHLDSLRYHKVWE